MAKLTGKAKKAFLARMNKGRIKAGLKKIATKTRSKGNKPRGSNPGSVAKNKGSRRSKVVSKSEKFIKGFLGGAGSAQLAGDGVALVTDNGTVQIATKLAAGAGGGYWVGKKSVEGAVGGILAELVDLGLNLARGGGGVVTSRLTRL